MPNWETLPRMLVTRSTRVLGLPPTIGTGRIAPLHWIVFTDVRRPYIGFCVLAQQALRVGAAVGVIGDESNTSLTSRTASTTSLPGPKLMLLVTFTLSVTATLALMLGGKPVVLSSCNR